MNKKTMVLGAVGTLLMASLVGCSSGQSAAEPAATSEDGITTVRVAYSVGSATLPVHVGIEKGIFEEHGLKLEGTQGTDWPTYVAALGQQYDLSMSSFGTVFPAMTKMDLEFVSGVQFNTEDAPNSVVVTDDPSIKTVEDLAGKRVGFPNVAGSYAQVLNYLLEAKGVDPNEVQYVQVGFAEQADQLKAGNVDAVVSALPFFTPLEEEGYDVLFDIYVEASKAATGTDRSFNVAWISTDDYAEQNPEVIKSFRAAMEESNQWVEDNKDEALDMMAEWSGLDRELLGRAGDPSVGVEITQEDLESMLIVAEANGIVPEDSINLDEAIWTED